MKKKIRNQILLIPGIGRRPSFSPLSLFAAGEQGAWYDPYDISTLFQDVAGTIPVTASGQTVGLHLDKSRGLVLGPELISNGTFDTDVTGWTAVNGAIVTWLAGVLSFQRTINAGDYVFTSFPTEAGASYLLVVGNETTTNSVTSARVGTTANGTQILPNTIVAGGLTATFTATSTTTFLSFIRGANGTSTLDNVSVRELPGNHRYQASAGSRPQYVEDGSLRYLLYDGVDDFMETNAVDFTATDKMTVWWGGRKLSDAALGCLIELSSNVNSNNGSFYLFGPITSNDYGFASKGIGVARSATSPATFASPISNVLCGIGDITAPMARLRINGAQVNEILTDQGTGNYGNHKLFFGRRGGVSFPANIHENQIIIRGAATNLATIERTELLVRNKVEITW